MCLCTKCWHCNKNKSLVLLKESDKMCACCKLLNAWALKHHLPDLEMNSTVITSSTVMCALLAWPTITLQSVVFHFWHIMETLTEYCICTFSTLHLSFYLVFLLSSMHISHVKVLFHILPPWSCALPADRTRSKCYNYFYGNNLEIWEILHEFWISINKSRLVVWTFVD